jgi:hypothetical protein
MPKEVLMSQSLRRARLSEPTLFHSHPHPMRPLSHDIQHKTIRLLARLLRLSTPSSGASRPHGRRRVMSDKITPHHVERKAMLYVRQGLGNNSSRPRPR